MKCESKRITNKTGSLLGVDPLPCWSVQIKSKLHKFFKRVHILEYTNVGVYKSITNQIQIKCDNRGTHTKFGTSGSASMLEFQIKFKSKV